MANKRILIMGIGTSATEARIRFCPASSAWSLSQCLLIEHGKIVSDSLHRAMTFLNRFLRAVEIE